MFERTVRSGFVWAVLLVAAALPLHVEAAEAGDIQALRELQERTVRQLEALTARVTQLEEANARLEQANTRLEATHENVADAAPSASAPARSPWLERFKWNADFRLRHEHTDQVGLPTRDRDRLQSHFGFEAALTDDVAVGLQLATGGDDPRSGNQTLTGEFSRKPIGLDLGYLRWSPAPGLAVTGGKMKYPVWKPASSKLYDGDVNPEGLALAVSRRNVFANLYAFAVEERALAADTTLVGAQAGTKLALGNAGSLTAALSYSDLGAGSGRQPFFAQAANGNPDGTLAFDFMVTHASLEYAQSLRSLPFVAFAEGARNSEAPDNLDTAYALGFLLGKASEPRSWEIGWLYQRVEKDAWFGQIFDSDFGGGLTDAKGSVFRFAYAAIPNGTLTATYYLNDVAISDPGSPDSSDEHRKLQFDFSMKF
jgi:hypothetical protein